MAWYIYYIYIRTIIMIVLSVFSFAESPFLIGIIMFLYLLIPNFLIIYRIINKDNLYKNCILCLFFDFPIRWGFAFVIVYEFLPFDTIPSILVSLIWPVLLTLGNYKQIKWNKNKLHNKHIVCDNCNELIPECSKICSYCGKIISFDEEYLCGNCGYAVDEHCKECPNCHLKFENDNSLNASEHTIADNYEELKKLKELLDDKIITKAEFEKEKKKILGD